MTYYLYTLNHPDNGNPFYVGMSQNMEDRMLAHLYNPSKALRSIIINMRLHGREPKANILASFEDKQECEKAEIATMRTMSKQYVLLNVRDLYPEEDKVNSICTRKYKCKKHGCPHCDKVRYWKVYKRIRMVRDLHLIEIYRQEWDKVRKYIMRNDYDGYIRLIFGSNFLVATTKPLKYGHKINPNDLDWEQVILNATKNGKRNSYSGVFAS